MKFQSPKGTRDFYPQQMAWRNHLIDTWRRVSIRNGFEQVDGPLFESLQLYKVKSGEGIVSELFHFKDRGNRLLALRPEFTPTLARMVAAKANPLSKPIKWFSTSNFCRAERPQRGRLREFWQWNLDMLGWPGPSADAECIFTAVDLLGVLGLGPDQVRVKISHRETMRHILLKLGVPEDRMLAAFDLLDRRDKLEPAQFRQRAAELGLDAQRLDRFDQTCRMKYPVGQLRLLGDTLGIDLEGNDISVLDEQLQQFRIAHWCEYDLGIVRGLAYYTGTVFEIHELSGVERAIAGGGRYDRLIELFGGPATAAVGFGMGDVVLTNVLIDKGLMPQDVAPRPDVFVIAPTEKGARRIATLTVQLRTSGLHARFSYKSTRNLAKLLKEAVAARARFAVILDDQVDQNVAALKNIDSGQQVKLPLGQLVEAIRNGR